MGQIRFRRDRESPLDDLQLGGRISEDGDVQALRRRPQTLDELKHQAWQDAVFEMAQSEDE